MIILEPRHVLCVAIHPVRQRGSECFGTPNAACEKFLFLAVQRRGDCLWTVDISKDIHTP